MVYLYSFLINFLILIIGYFIGSFNISILMSKKIEEKGKDIRNRNSGNAGATNSLRTYGKKFAFLVFIFDFLKCFIPTIILVSIFNHAIYTYVDEYKLFSHLIALGVVIGHILPIYHKFKGGKGVACSVGFVAAINPIIFIIAAILFFTIYFIWKYVALASILTAILVIPFIFIPWIILEFSGAWLNVFKFIPGNMYKFWYVQGIIFTIAMIFVITSHHSNISNLIHKKESKLVFKYKKDKGE